MRTRLYTISTELGITNKEVLDKCKELGFEVKSHSSTMDEAQTEALRAALGGAAAPAPAKAAKKKPTAARPRARRVRKAPKAAKPAVAAKPAAPPKAPKAAKPAVAAKPAAPPKAPKAAKPAAAAKPEAPPKAPAAQGAAEAKEKPTPERSRRGRRRREGTTAQVVGRIELPTQDTLVREYGPHVRIKERRGGGGARRGRPRRRPARRPRARQRRVAPRPIVERPSKVTLSYPVTLRALSEAAGIKVDALVRTLMTHDVMTTINDPLADAAVELLSAEHEVEIEVKRGRDLEQELQEAQAQPDRPEDLVSRPPVVTFLGHVDHGKTSLLDAIRQSHVVEGESGGITQHIGAYTVEQGDRKVTFLDTPGHAAFTAMRARGAQVTDIAVLVVAADDGVMPQTEEAINHAKAAGVPIVVAVNKIDLPAAQPQRVMQQFAALDLLPATWGGETEFVEVSAITRQGLDDLVETLALQAEILELKANPNKAASGHVLEANLDPGRGSVATILIREGTLRRGDIVLAGAAYGRARVLHDDRGRPVKEAGPSSPVELAGLSAVPAAGDAFVVLDELDRARQIAESRARREREATVAERKQVTLENLFETLDRTEVNVLRVILKADVQGSIEVLRKSLGDLATDEVAVKFLHVAVGGINESDVLLAEASEAIIIGFHVVADTATRALADERKVDIRLYNVIYHLTDDVKAALESKLEPERREEVLGHAEVRQIFRISRIGNVAGCFVTDGRVNRNDRVRLTRDGVVIYEGTIGSLRRVKDDVREVPNNMECGIKIANYADVKEGDVIEAFEVIEIKRTL